VDERLDDLFAELDDALDEALGPPGPGLVRETISHLWSVIGGATDDDGEPMDIDAVYEPEVWRE
jgi:hypothetical protein